jgi:predicted ArsR family transcriptional regulator
MDVQTLLAPDATAPLGQSRARVLDILRAAGSPLGAQEVAQQTGLHPNTARFHLDALVDAGLAVREALPRATPGRPSVAYRPTDSGGPAGSRRYRLLAEILTTLIAGVMPEPREAAAQAGREWGRYLTQQPAPYQRPDAGQSIETLSAILAELGFSPEAVSEGARHQLRLHQCPFREVAENHQDVVCSMHLGLMQGALAQMRAPITADRLLPFAESGVCIADLGAGPDQPPRGQRRDRSPDA